MAHVDLVTDKTAGPAANLLKNIEQKLGRVPNIFQAMANSPAVLQGYLGLSESTNATSLSPDLREKIALIVGESNKCDYCLAAHTAIAQSLHVSDEDILAARRAASKDAKTTAILKFCERVVEKRGLLDDNSLSELKNSGVTDQELVEIIFVISFNIFTNYFNHIIDPEIDFPAAPSIENN